MLLLLLLLLLGHFNTLTTIKWYSADTQKTLKWYPHYYHPQLGFMKTRPKELKTLCIGLRIGLCWGKALSIRGFFPENRWYLENTGHWKLGGSRKFWKNIDIKKTGHLETSGVVWHSGKTLIFAKSRKFWKIGVAGKSRKTQQKSLELEAPQGASDW